MFGSTSDTDCAEWDLAAAERKAKWDVEWATGEKEKVAASERLALANAAIQDRKFGTHAQDELKKLFDSPQYKGYEPATKLVFNGILNRGLALGTISGKDLAKLNDDIRKYKYLGSDACGGGKDCYYFGGKLETQGILLPPWLIH